MGPDNLLLSNILELWFDAESMYMQGLAAGFVLLRIEALTEEGKL